MVQSLARTIAILIFVFTGIGCTTLSINVPGPLIESPELSGQAGKLEISTGVDDATRYSYTSTASSRPPVLNSPDQNNRSAYLFGRAGYSLTEWLEVSGRLIPGSAQNLFLGGGALTTRAQILGIGTGPGIKLAVYAGFFGVSANESGDQDGTFGPGGYNWKARAQAMTTSAGGSLGYRFEGSSALVYIAGSYADHRITGSIDHELSSNGASPAASYTLPEIKANTRTAALGLRLGDKVQFGGEARAIQRSWPGTSVPETRGGGESTEGVFALSLTFR